MLRGRAVEEPRQEIKLLAGSTVQERDSLKDGSSRNLREHLIQGTHFAEEERQTLADS